MQRTTALVATLALGLFLAPGVASAAHHEKGEGHGEANPCRADENPCKANPCKAEKGSGEANPCAEKKDSSARD